MHLKRELFALHLAAGDPRTRCTRPSLCRLWHTPKPENKCLEKSQPILSAAPGPIAGEPIGADSYEPAGLAKHDLRDRG